MCDGFDGIPVASFSPGWEVTRLSGSGFFFLGQLTPPPQGRVGGRSGPARPPPSPGWGGREGEKPYHYFEPEKNDTYFWVSWHPPGEYRGYPLGGRYARHPFSWVPTGPLFNLPNKRIFLGFNFSRRFNHEILPQNVRISENCLGITVGFSKVL